MGFKFDWFVILDVFGFVLKLLGGVGFFFFVIYFCILENGFIYIVSKFYVNILFLNDWLF